MKTDFYKSWSDEQVDSKAAEIEAAFEKELISLYQDAAGGTIPDYDAMIEAVIGAGCKYAPDLCDMGKTATEEELYASVIEAIKEARGTFSLQDHAQQWLDCMTAIM